MKKVFGLGSASILALTAPAIFAFTQPVAAMAQAQVAPVTIHGKVTNPAGAAMVKGDVRLTKDKSANKDRKYDYTFPIDATGNFKGTGIAPGDYLIVVYADDKTVDFQDTTLKTGEDRTVDFDMTRAEYLKGMSDADRKALEEYKKKNASVSAENAKIANINQTLTQARADEKAGKADDAVTALQGLSTQKADEPVIWASLGEAQLASADQAAKAARAAKTSPQDPAILQKYTDSAASYQKAIDLSATKKTTPETIAGAYLNMGQALAKSGKLKEAGDAYDASAKALPANSGTAYYNEAAVFFNAGNMDQAAAAADKAIAADPKRADAYYIKGQALIPKATVDPKTQKIVAPPGCVEAYQQYLEIAPDGPHAADVKELLTNLGQPVKNSFKAGKK